MEASQYLPTVAWRTNIENVILLTSETVPDPATYRVSVYPIDVNEPGAMLEEKEIGFYLKDFVGHTYRIIGIGSGVVDISDDFRTGVGPQTGQEGVVYKSVGDGVSPYLAPVYYRGLDKSAMEYSRRFELDILWKKLYATFYHHVQSAPSRVWEVNHGLMRVPSVVITDANGIEYETQVDHLDINNTVITFSEALAGFADFN